MNNEYDLSKNEFRTAQRNGKSLLCPKCKTKLSIGYDRDIEVDFCLKCSGIWVDHIEEKQLLEIKPETFTIDELKRLRKLYKPLGKDNTTSGYSPCPICEQLMQRRNWGSYSGVIVDKCMYHGTWYDANELDKIKEFIATGGIEFEKLKLTENGLSELELKLMQKAHQLDQRIDSSYARARLYGMLGL